MQNWEPRKQVSFLTRKSITTAFMLNCRNMLVRPTIVLVLQQRQLCVQSLLSLVHVSFAVCTVRRNYLGHLCRKELWFLPGCLCAWLLLVLLKVLRELNLLSSTWMEQLDSLFLVLNNCAFLWKDLLCPVAHGHVFGSSLGCINMIIHWGEKNLGS